MSTARKQTRPRYKLKKPIVLVGLMGAGKSTIGARLASKLGLPFRDSDNEIEEAAACSVRDLFDIYGEDVFRDLELRVVQRLVKKKNQILATGGGSFIQPKVRKAIMDQAFTVWLRADLTTLLERVSRRDTRPLLAGKDKKAILDRLIAERYPIYEEADLIIDSNNGPHETIVQDIITELEKPEYDLFHRH